MIHSFIKVLVCLIFFIPSLRADFKVQELPLSGGINVRWVEDHTLPIVSIVLLIQGGDAYDPLDKPFLSGAVMDLLGEGTETLPAEVIKEIFLDKGIQLSFTPTGAFFQTGRREAVAIHLRTTTARFAEALDLLRSILFTSRFHTMDVQEWVRRTYATLLNMKKDPDFIAENALRSLIYGDSPWGHSYLTTTLNALESITPLDIRHQWSQFLTADRLYIGVCGDISADSLAAHLEKLLKDIPPKSSLPALGAAAFPDQAGQRVITTAHPQAMVILGHPGISRTHKDYPAFALMTHILGGGMSARLFKEIREKQGLVYSIGATPQDRRSGPVLFFSFESKNDQVPKALEELRHQLILLKEKGMSEEELQDAKTSLVGMMTQSLASTLSIASRLAASAYGGEAKTFYDDFKEAIDKLTLSDINYFIKTFLQPDRLQTVIVGNITADQLDPERHHDTSPTHSPAPLPNGLPSTESTDSVGGVEK